MGEVRGWVLRFLEGRGVFEDTTGSSSEPGIAGGEGDLSAGEKSGETGASMQAGECAGKEGSGEKMRVREQDGGTEEDGNEEVGREADTDTDADAIMHDASVSATAKATATATTTATSDIYKRMAASGAGSTLDAPSTRTSVPVPPKPEVKPPSRQTSSNGMREKKMKLNAFHFSYAA
jgi:hypothetical protein